MATREKDLFGDPRGRENNKKLGEYRGEAVPKTKGKKNSLVDRREGPSTGLESGIFPRDQGVYRRIGGKREGDEAGKTEERDKTKNTIPIRKHKERNAGRGKLGGWTQIYLVGDKGEASYRGAECVSAKIPGPPLRFWKKSPSYHDVEGSYVGVRVDVVTL